MIVVYVLLMLVFGLENYRTAQVLMTYKCKIWPKVMGLEAKVMMILCECQDVSFIQSYRVMTVERDVKEEVVFFLRS